MKKRKNKLFLFLVLLIGILIISLNSNIIFAAAQSSDYVAKHHKNLPFWQPQEHDLDVSIRLPLLGEPNNICVFDCFDVSPFQCGASHCQWKDEIGFRDRELCGYDESAGKVGNNCPEGTVCDYLHTPHTCVTCTPEDILVTCAGRTCGSATDNCGNTINCGTCPTGQTCNPDGQCEADKQQLCPDKCPLPNICCSLFNKISNNNQVFFCVPPEKIPEKFCNVPQTYCGDGIVQTPNSQGQNEECDAGKSCIYDSAPDKKKCKSSNDCKEFNTNGLKCDACEKIDTIQCTKDCKCNGMYFKKPEKTCAINDKGSYFIINKQGYWERNFKNNKCSISNYLEISLNSKECSNCKKCSFDYPYQTVNLKKGEESFVYFDIFNPFEISISPAILASEGGLYIDIEENIKIPSKTNKVIKFKVIGYNCGKFKNKISIKLLNYVYDVYVYANVNCGECKYNYNENEFNIEPVCNTDSEKEGKECISSKLSQSSIDSEVKAKCSEETKENKGACYFGECSPVCETISNEKDFYDRFNIELKFKTDWSKLNNEMHQCIQDLCDAIKDLPSPIKKSIKIISIGDSKSLQPGGFYFGFGLIYVNNPVFCKSAIYHEVAHAYDNNYNLIDEKFNLYRTWVFLTHNFIKYGLGELIIEKKDINGDLFYEWKDQPPKTGPRYGLIEPYGAGDIHEDIATFVSSVKLNPDLITSLIKSEKGLGVGKQPYLERLTFLYLRGFISCEEYYIIIKKAGYSITIEQ